MIDAVCVTEPCEHLAAHSTLSGAVNLSAVSKHTSSRLAIYCQVHLKSPINKHTRVQSPIYSTTDGASYLVQPTYRYNKKFSEELIAYFPWHDSGHVENDASNNMNAYIRLKGEEPCSNPANWQWGICISVGRRFLEGNTRGWNLAAVRRTTVQVTDCFSEWLH
jgi:hypothetical protein